MCRRETGDHFWVKKTNKRKRAKIEKKEGREEPFEAKGVVARGRNFMEEALGDPK